MSLIRDPQGTKTCRLCLKLKPLAAFYRDPTGGRGRRSRCMECIRPIHAAAFARRTQTLVESVGESNAVLNKQGD
jgi:hypothetical protein